MRQHPFFLESGPGFGELGRYTFKGCDPFLVLRAKGTSVEIIAHRTTQRLQGDPFEILRQLLKEYATPCNPNDSPLASGGAIGYLGYDLRHFVENLPRQATDDLHLPDLWMGFYREIETKENTQDFSSASLNSCISAFLLFFPSTPISRRSTRSIRYPDFRLPPSIDSLGRSTTLIDSLGRSATLTFDSHSSFSKVTYLEAIRRVQDYILAGDVYQVNLSQRFEVPIQTSAFDFYRKLNRRNPAPFAAYLNCGRFSVISISPERFLRFDPLSRIVETRPIKGTRPRGETPEEDEALAAGLSRSEKDRAEHLMIVDLERNDLGRVCEVGSVHVPDLWRLERHPTVWHLVSTIRGKLHPGLDRIDLLRATFPGGSITGAPKIRAMEIIDEVEPTMRGVYTGAIGYVGFDGRMDLSIAIRTAIVKDGMAYFHVGGGIVADSDPEMEYQETLDKAKAMFEVLT
ncbi:MAG: aminodeoxychorismate synthase component I [Candidatus Latescibacteria bacterium]|nr:aminodeoxychorismate synthase component I [Candidatus Latescibacterota bacterium]